MKLEASQTLAELHSPRLAMVGKCIEVATAVKEFISTNCNSFLLVPMKSEQGRWSERGCPNASNEAGRWHVSIVARGKPGRTIADDAGDRFRRLGWQ